MNNALSFFGSPEGRVVKKGSAYEYEYAIADHQGNTRVVFSSVTAPPTVYTATFENATVATETSNFLNYGFNSPGVFNDPWGAEGTRESRGDRKTEHQDAHAECMAARLIVLT